MKWFSFSPCKIDTSLKFELFAQKQFLPLQMWLFPGGSSHICPLLPQWSGQNASRLRGCWSRICSSGDTNPQQSLTELQDSKENFKTHYILIAFWMPFSGTPVLHPNQHSAQCRGPPAFPTGCHQLRSSARGRIRRTANIKDLPSNGFVHLMHGMQPHIIFCGLLT